MDLSFIILIIMIPIVSGFLGWITNWIAIRSLFRPINKVKIFGFEFWGVIPKRKKKLAKNIAEVVNNHFFSSKDILSNLATDANKGKIKEKVLPEIENKILDKIPSMFRDMARPFLGKILQSEVDDLIDKMIEFGKDYIQKEVDVEQIIREKIENYSIEELEQLVYKIAKKELKHIERLGFVIGFIVGVFQVLFMIILM